MIAVAFISDRGNQYLPGCVESFDLCVDRRHIGGMHVVDDSAHQLGLAGAVQAAWEWALSTGCDYLFHVEEDFRFHTLPLAQMQWILETNPHLAQVVLKRQPWSAEEKAAGGQIETNPGAYTQRRAFGRSIFWVEHTTLFSLNPCLIPRRVLELGWPSGPIGVGNETGFTAKCHAAGLSFAYFGKIEDPPRCEHVGHHRGSGWRL